MQGKYSHIVVFMFNAKSFAIAILVFFYFFFSFSSLFLDELPKDFSKRFNISYLERMRPRSDSILKVKDTVKSISVKIVPQVVIRDPCGTWHELCTITNIYSIQKKHNKQPETWK